MLHLAYHMPHFVACCRLPLRSSRKMELEELVRWHVHAEHLHGMLHAHECIAQVRLRAMQGKCG